MELFEIVEVQSLLYSVEAMPEEGESDANAAGADVILLPAGLFQFTKIYAHLKHLCHVIEDTSNDDCDLYTEEDCECFLNKISIISDILSSCEKECNLFSPELVHEVRFIPEKFRITKPGIHKIKTEVEQKKEKERQLIWDKLKIDHIQLERNVFIEHFKCTMNPKLGLANQTDGTLVEMATYKFIETVLFGKKYSWREMYKKIWDTPLPPRIQREICTALFRPLTFLFRDPLLVVFAIFSRYWSRLKNQSTLQVTALILSMHQCTCPVGECIYAYWKRNEIDSKLGQAFNNLTDRISKCFDISYTYGLNSELSVVYS